MQQMKSGNSVFVIKTVCVTVPAAHMLLLPENTTSTAAPGARGPALTAPGDGERSRKHTGAWPLSRGAPRQ